MTVVLQFRETGNLVKLENAINFWMDTNHFFVKFKDGSAKTLFRRHLTLYRIKDDKETTTK